MTGPNEEKKPASRDRKLPGRAIYLSRRLPAIYVERAKCVRAACALFILYEGAREDGSTGGVREQIPVDAQSIIMFGPGCSVTTEAMKLMTRSGCAVAFTGGGGAPVFATSTAYRNPSHKIRQYRLSTDAQSRLEIARRLMDARGAVLETLGLRGMPLLTGHRDAPDVATITAIEGAWARRTYAWLSRHHGIPYENKEKTYAAISLTNHFVYSLAHAAIEARGFDPNVGIIHGQTRGGGLVFDLADVWKPALSLVPALEGTAADLPPGAIKADVLKRAASTKALEGMTDLLAELFG